MNQVQIYITVRMIAIGTNHEKPVDQGSILVRDLDVLRRLGLLQKQCDIMLMKRCDMNMKRKGLPEAD
jgi:hypothetical protein